MNLSLSRLCLLPEVKLDGFMGHVCDLIHLQDTELFADIVPGKNWEGGGHLLVENTCSFLTFSACSFLSHYSTDSFSIGFSYAVN